MDIDNVALSRKSRRTWLGALALWLALAAVTSSALWQLRRDTLESQSRELDLLSLTLTDGIDRGLRGVDEGLHALSDELQEGRLTLTDIQTGQTLGLRADLMPLVQTLWLLNAEGRVMNASDDTPAPALASFHPAPASLDEDAVSLSLPFNGAQADESLVAMAVPYRGVTGGNGWIVASIPTDDLLGAFGVGMPLEDTRAWVFRGDGARLVGVNTLDVTLSDVAVVRRLANRPGIELRRYQDGSDHLVALNGVPRYHAQVMVSRDLVSVLRSWRQAAEVASAALVLLMTSMAVAVYFVLLADRRRAESRRALEAQASRTTRLESLGTLAGSVAHDFNNVLAGIVGFGEMAQDAALPGSTQARHIDKVLQAALRGKSLVDRILAFSRAGAKASSVFELKPVIEEVLTLLSASLGPGTALERVFEAPGGRLRGDATQVFEAVMNLCTNALQAMPRGGTLAVSVTREPITRPRILSHGQLAAGDHLLVAVSDQGSGISPEVTEHLFEPFFTTRAAQSGTGLGLAVVFGVVTEFGGAIDVQNRPGRGARFSLYFPECKDALPASERDGPKARTGQGQRLLVIDDEPELVAMTVEMLTGLGYTPVGHTDAHAALHALQGDPQAFAAVITDEVMPGLTGTHLTQMLRPHAPDLPVLLVSGYGGALLAQRASEAGVTRVMGKPLQREQLAQALAELLA
jgi:signal transduction histidine kinase